MCRSPLCQPLYRRLRRQHVDHLQLQLLFSISELVIVGPLCSVNGVYDLHSTAVSDVNFAVHCDRCGDLCRVDDVSSSAPTVCLRALPSIILLNMLVVNCQLSCASIANGGRYFSSACASSPRALVRFFTSASNSHAGWDNRLQTEWVCVSAVHPATALCPPAKEGC